MMNLLIKQFPSVFCYFLSLRSKYSPKHPSLKYSQYSLKVRDQVSHAYRRASTIAVYFNHPYS
jgi:hypothetical protein